MNLFKVTEKSKVPLIGCIAFGLVLRPNSNVIQVREIVNKKGFIEKKSIN